MTDYDKALSHALLMLGHEAEHAKARIAEVARLAIQVVTTMAPKDKPALVDEARLTRELEALVTWRVGRDFVIDTDEDHIQWLPAKRGTTEWRFWNRYRRYLIEKPKPISSAVVASIDDLTDKVLERLEGSRQEGTLGPAGDDCRPCAVRQDQQFHRAHLQPGGCGLSGHHRTRRRARKSQVADANARR